MRNYLVFGGIDTRDYGIYISGYRKQKIPQRPYEVVQVPGRFGDLLVGGNSMSNEEISYPAFFAPANGTYGLYATYEAAYSAFRRAMLRVTGYATLTDTYDTGHYRKAVFTGGVDIDTTQNLDAGSFELVFNAKPQRYVLPIAPPVVVLGGDDGAIEDGVIIDTNGLSSEPVINVQYTGRFTFFESNGGKDYGATIGRTPRGNLSINSERKEIYDLTGQQLNTSVQLLRYEFPVVNMPFEQNTDNFMISATGVNLFINFNWFEL